MKRGWGKWVSQNAGPTACFEEMDKDNLASASWQTLHEGNNHWRILLWPCLKASSELWELKQVLSSQQAVSGIPFGPVALCSKS